TAEIYRKIQGAVADVGGQEVLVRVNPEMAAYFQDEEAEGLELLQRRIQRKVTLQAVQALHKDEYEIITREGASGGGGTPPPSPPPRLWRRSRRSDALGAAHR